MRQSHSRATTRTSSSVRQATHVLGENEAVAALLIRAGGRYPALSGDYLAARLTALRLGATDWTGRFMERMLSSSIHSSSLDFLKRQRLPSLKAGMRSSATYL